MVYIMYTNVMSGGVLKDLGAPFSIKLKI